MRRGCGPGTGSDAGSARAFPGGTGGTACLNQKTEGAGFEHAGSQAFKDRGDGFERHLARDLFLSDAQLHLAPLAQRD